MSVSRCMGEALRIAETPRAGWQVKLAEISVVCPHTDCSPGGGCRQRIADYLRVQYRIQVRKEARSK